MRQVTTFVLMIAFLAAATKHLSVGTAYFANKNFIAEELCENKEEPILNCDGKCYLRKEFEKQEKTENDNPIETKEQISWVLGMHYSPKIVCYSFFNENAVFPKYKFTLKKGHINAIFHPPTV